MSSTITVTCPLCHAELEIDVEAAVVTRHKAVERPHEAVDFDDRLQQIEREKARAADRMAEAMRAEQSKERLLADKFKKLMGEVSEDDDEEPPLRDIDL